MLKLRYIFILILLPYFAFSQIQDDFSDGDFTSNPSWSGDNTQFKINTSKKLQLNNSTSDTSYLSTANTLINNTEWRFYIKQSFNSSSNNYSRIYLVSNQANLKSNLNGYFVQFGSTQDDICLYRQDGNTLTKLISGTVGYTGNSVNEFTLKITRDANGNWELFSDANAGSNFQSEGTATDLNYQSTSYFGLWCKYTSSNSKKVYFDDVYVGGIVVDTIPPKLTAIHTLDAHHIDLYFNEAVDSSSTNNNTHYSVSPILGNPTSAVRNINDHSLVHLYYSGAFVQGTLYTLTTNNIKDMSGNIAPSQQMNFGWHEIQYGDVTINEIMADPSPKVALPEWEYIELYNNTIFPVSLKNWTLQIGKSIKILPDSSIAPHSYILIGHQNAEADLSNFGTFIGLSSFSLTNASQELILKNEKNQLIHYIHYNSNWYQDNNKKEGGWSLEQIDPNNPCGGQKNWTASTSNMGGTPGSENAVFAANPDKTKPEGVRVSEIDSMTIVAHFSESMDSINILDANKYEVSNFGKPVWVGNAYPEYNSVTLKFAKAFQKQTIYDLVFTGTAKDCAGNSNSSISFRFGMAEKPEANDIIINEILFDPQSPGVDYIEIKNRTNKIFDLKDLRLANWNEETQSFENIKHITSESYLIYQYGYYVFCTNSLIVQKQYLVRNPRQIIEIPSMISMPSSEGSVAILTANFEQIDRFDYNKDMHFALLQNTKGISLERINPDLPTNDRNSWHSAATNTDAYSQTADFAGTPTSINSQYSNGVEFNGEVWLHNNLDIFSPDNDGRDDVLLIDYKFPDAGYTANVRVYDVTGKLIRNLVNNELLATKGMLSWDGLDNNNQKANIGIYIIYAEIFNLNGDVKHFKLKAVLAGHL